MKYQLITGDCLEKLKTLPDNSIDSIVTDPPYGLSELSSDKIVQTMFEWSGGNWSFIPKGKGFMNKDWDSFVPPPAVWKEVIRVLKPGAFILCFAGTRTVDLMTVSLRVAGFEIRDTLMWLYGSGFPKSHNLKGEFSGWGTALKPAVEPIILARKPLEDTVLNNMTKWGVGALNIDSTRLETSDDLSGGTYGGSFGFSRDEFGNLPKALGSGDKGRWPANLLLDEESAGMLGEPSRFFYVSKTSISEREYGLNSLPDRYIAKGNQAQSELKKGNTDFSKDVDTGGQNKILVRKNSHPTVKPIKLMSYLCTLITPSDGVILDPFMGSGSTGIAAVISGFNFIGIEMSEEYVEISRLRIEHNLRSRFDI
jgi:DNA modification methylase